MKLQTFLYLTALFIVGCSSTPQINGSQQNVAGTMIPTAGKEQDLGNAAEQSLVEAEHTPVVTVAVVRATQGAAVNETEPVEEELAGWTMITAGDGAVCADGSPYSFWVREGHSKKLFVYFQGFNRPFFCNDPESCSQVKFDDSIHLAEEYSVAALIDVNADEPDRIEAGVFDFANLDNPLRDFSVVYIPICSADLHWGNNLQTYALDSGESIEVYHQGYANTNSALNWAYENLPDANQIFVSGCEVGAPGSILHTVTLREHYPAAQIAQLGEGYAGIFPETVEYESSWKVRSSLPEWLNKSLPDPFTLADLYTAIAVQYPDIGFAQFNYGEDWIQAYNYTSQTFDGIVFEKDIDFTSFTRDLLETLEMIQAQAPNFHTFTVYGEEESKLPSNCGQVSSFMETMKVEDTHYIDWLTALVDGEQVSNVQGTLTYESRK